MSSNRFQALNEDDDWEDVSLRKNKKTLEPSTNAIVEKISEEDNVEECLLSDLIVNKNVCIHCLVKKCARPHEVVPYPKYISNLILEPILIQDINRFVRTNYGKMNEFLNENFKGKKVNYTICLFNHCRNACRNARFGRISSFKFDNEEIHWCFPDKPDRGNRINIGLHIDIKLSGKGQNQNVEWDIVNNPPLFKGDENFDNNTNFQPMIEENQTTTNNNVVIEENNTIQTETIQMNTNEELKIDIQENTKENTGSDTNIQNNGIKKPNFADIVKRNQQINDEPIGVEDDKSTVTSNMIDDTASVRSVNQTPRTSYPSTPQSFSSPRGGFNNQRFNMNTFMNDMYEFMNFSKNEFKRGFDRDCFFKDKFDELLEENKQLKNDLNCQIVLMNKLKEKVEELEDTVQQLTSFDSKAAYHANLEKIMRLNNNKVSDQLLKTKLSSYQEYY